MNLYKPLLEKYPKAKPLAKTLIAAASEQGASVEELELACSLAKEVCYKTQKKQLLAQIQSDAEARLDSI